MKILILGSQGFIGSNLVNYFITRGDAVSGCDLVEFSGKHYTYHRVSILSPDFETLFINHSFDICINASGSGNVAFSVNQPISDFEANTISVVKVLDTLKKYQPTCKYIHISSAAVYGNPKMLPVKENDGIYPVSPYGYHKWMSEIICKEYCNLYQLQIAVVRPFSVYGPGLKKQLIWDICEKLKAADIITLYGTGNESRDFLHVSDLCELLNKIILKSEFNTDIYNAASGIETTIREIADIFENKSGEKKRILFSGEFRVGDPINWLADISRINKLDFTPAVSLKIGIHNYMDWYLQVTK